MSSPVTTSQLVTDMENAFATILDQIAVGLGNAAPYIASILVGLGIVFVLSRYGRDILGSVFGWLRGLF